MLPLGGSIHTLNKYKETLLFASKERGLEIILRKQSISSRHAQNAGQNHNTKKGNKSFERVGEFRCLATTLTDQNSIHEEKKTRLKSKNTCYYWVQNLLPSSLLSKNIKIKIYRIIILSPVLYESENLESHDKGAT
jgi:hypothetical protein